MWKKSATLILAARASIPTSGQQLSHPSGSGVGGAGASLAAAPSPFDYRVLLLKRSGKSSFLPNGCVFPGGCVAQSDFSDKWVNLFDEAGVDLKQLSRRVLSPEESETGCRPPMLTADLGSSMSNEVAFRICAIRETFEESGILICTRAIGTGCATVSAEHCMTEEAVSEWRRLIMNDDSQFMTMFKELNLLPDICSLHEWSNWLTPTRLLQYANSLTTQRFDTMFYVCCLETEPPTVHDDEEIVHSQWISPAEILKSFSNKRMALMPPQVYEVSRLCTFSQLSDLSSFAMKRRGMGCEQWMNVGIRCTDGFLLVLPGDDLYPVEPDMEGILPQLSLPYSLKDAQANSNRHNRMLLHDDGTLYAYCTITQKYNHVSPAACTN